MILSQSVNHHPSSSIFAFDMVDGGRGDGGGGEGSGGGGGDFGGIGGEFGFVDRKFSAASTISGTISHNAFIDMSARRPLLKSSTKKERRLLLVIVLLAVLVFILVILIAVYAARYRNARQKPDVCLTEKCVVAASSISESMDTTVAPCDDFFRYACGNFGETHLKPTMTTSFNWYSYAQSLKMLAIKENLRKKSTEEDPEILDKTRSLYSTCVDEDAADAGSLKPLWKVLNSLKLPTPSVSNRSSSPKWTLRDILAVALPQGLPLLVNLDVMGEPKNNSKVHLYIKPPPVDKGILPGYPPYEERVGRFQAPRRSSAEIERREALRAEKDSAERMGQDTKRDKAKKAPADVQYAARVMALLHAVDVIRRTGDLDALDNIPKPAEFYDTAYAAIRLESRLMEIANNASTSDDGDIFTMKELQEIWDNATVNDGEEVADWINVNWKDLLYDSVFDAKVHWKSSSKQKVLLESEEWFTSLAEILLETEPHVVGDYLWWIVVKNLGPYTSKIIRNEKELFLDTIYDEFSPPSRQLFCANAMYKLLPEVASFSVLKEDEAKNATQDVLSMMKDILSAFKSSVHSVKWLDKDTRRAAIKKVEAMKIWIGGPRRMDDWLSLDDFYKDLTLKEDAFLDQLLQILKFRYEGRIKKLLKREADWDEDTEPLEANAFYSPARNTILLPYGIINFPFSGLGLEALDYGNLGATLGHELVHGFDSTGRLFDHAGNLYDWWSNASAQQYEKLSDCFINQYNTYEIEGLNTMVNGERTLGENIADNGGLSAALEAFRKARRRRGRAARRKALPGLENLSEEQLFFLSYGVSWCEVSSPETVVNYLEDSHAPPNVRLLASLRNSVEFVNAFGCNKGSSMWIPERDRCKIW